MEEETGPHRSYASLASHRQLLGGMRVIVIITMGFGVIAIGTFAAAVLAVLRCVP